MRQIGRQVKQVARLQRVRLAGEGKLTFAGQHLDDCVLGGSVLGQFLPLRKAEQDDARGLVGEAGRERRKRQCLARKNLANHVFDGHFLNINVAHR